MSKRKAKPSTQAQTNKEPDLPFPWNAISRWLPPPLRSVILTVAVLVVLGLSLWDPIKDVVNLLHERDREGPAIPSVWVRQDKAKHPEGRYNDIFVCTDNFGLMPQAIQPYSSTISFESPNQLDDFLNKASTLAPAFLTFYLDRQLGQNYDTVDVTSLELEVKRVSDFNASAVLIIQRSVCAGEGPHGAQAYIRAKVQTMEWTGYNVLRTRYTDPDLPRSISLSSPSAEPVVVYISLTDPGWYEARLKAQYQYPGSETKTVYSDSYLLARPDLGQVKELRIVDNVNLVMDSGDDLLMKEVSSRYEGLAQFDIKILLQQGEPPTTNTKARFIQLINLGDLDVDLQDWYFRGTTQGQTPQTLEYVLPSYELKSGDGVRVWIASGNDAGPDLYWFHPPAISPTEMSYTPINVELYDKAGQRVGWLW